MARLFRDPFTQWLEAKGTKPAVYQPGGMLGAPPLGWQLNIGHSTLVYRVPKETPEILIIVMIERQSQRQGLRSPFADLVRFVSLVRQSETGIHEIQGHVEAVSWRPGDSLESARIHAFYQRYLGVRQVRVENGVAWVGGNLDTFVPPLSAHRSDDASQDMPS